MGKWSPDGGEALEGGLWLHTVDVAPINAFMGEAERGMVDYRAGTSLAPDPEPEIHPSP